MSIKQESWPALSYLESLRPYPGETVEFAILTAYSADLASIGAALLALAGLDSDAGQGTPADFADAVEQLRGKVRIIIQRGRLSGMRRRTPRIAAVLDQFVREVDFDEASHSWHPKVAMVRMRSDSGEIRWRLWIGSRNLTECVNRDIGILLVSGGNQAHPIDGFAELGRSLAERAGLKGVGAIKLSSSLRKVAWRAPTGVTVRSLRWSSGLVGMSPPIPPVGTNEIIIVSPFVDNNFLKSQTSPGTVKPHRTLLTTMREIERVGPVLKPFTQLLTLDGPEYPAADHGLKDTSSDLDSGADAADEEEQIGKGLHAKLLFWRSGKKTTLWLGSANATMRAWSGRNAEATLELGVNEAAVEGLRVLLGSAKTASVPDCPIEPDVSTIQEEEIERARAQIAARWGATLSIEKDAMRLQHYSADYPTGPHPDDNEMTLEIGSLNGELRVWPRETTNIQLGEIVPAERTEFVRLRVSKGDNAASWLQRAPADPPFGAERDRAAFVRLLGARGFLQWLAGLLANDSQHNEGDWTIEQVAERLSTGQLQSLDTSLPTLEEILSAWARDSKKFGEIERRVSEYLPAVLEHARREDPDAVVLLNSFNDLWRKILAGLNKNGSARRR